MDGFGNDFLGPDPGRQVEALIMAFHQPLEAAWGTNTARLALKAKAIDDPSRESLKLAKLS